MKRRVLYLLKPHLIPCHFLIDRHLLNGILKISGSVSSTLIILYQLKTIRYRMEKLIVVCGATGTLGKSVVYALLEDSSVAVRGITSNVEGRSATALAELGVEMMAASAEDKPSLERAFGGAYGVFIVTDFYKIHDQAKEIQMGKNMVDAAKSADVKHVVIIGAKSVKKLLNKDVPSMDDRAEIEEYLFASGLSATSLHLAMPMGVLMTFLQKTKDGKITLNIPMAGKKLYSYKHKAVGGPVAAIFNDPEKYKGLTIGLAGDHLTVQEYCDVINKLRDDNTLSAGKMTAKEFVEYQPPAKRPFAEVICTICEFYQSDHPSFDLEKTKGLHPETLNFEQFMSGEMSKLQKMLKYLD
ncbi:nmrA-like family domain-containing protein 1 [Lytechinus variegatus]|uniref:nmrA-like family domain-containing protein 1 n=1 Tax=Lytechinus variegatus TaxID=7654 RepID=UPI001BB0DFEC|nr:nmrA-like family domain-containing protein 1 [Lytechinus variegatus]